MIQFPLGLSKQKSIVEKNKVEIEFVLLLNKVISLYFNEIHIMAENADICKMSFRVIRNVNKGLKSICYIFYSKFLLL